MCTIQSASAQVKMGSDKLGKHLIYITHFISPHHFWFKFDDPDKSNRAALIELDAEIHEYATKRQFDKKWSPHRSSIVAAWVNDWNKWVRGKVENVVEVESGTPRYFLWAIDYGRPISVIANHTVPLPRELAEINISAVQEGCIYGILPAEQVCLVARNFR